MWEALWDELMALDLYESLAKRHYCKYGRGIDNIQYIYLTINGGRVQTPEDLYSADARKEQQRINEAFRQSNGPGPLSSQIFLPPGKNIQIEKLLRYVDIPSHSHDFVECAYVVSGRCVHRIEDRDYLQEKGSFVTIPPGFFHALLPDEDCLCLTMKIRVETFIEMGFPNIANFVCPLSFLCGDDPFIWNSIASMWTQQAENLAYCDQIIELIFQTMMLYIQQQFQDGVQYLVWGSYDPQVVAVLSFMKDNFKSITLQSVAEQFHYSPAYLSRMFHERIGVTFSAVLKQYKLEQAAKILSAGKHKLNEVCDEVGYKDVAQFSRSFKELFGVTPAKYGKQMNSAQTIMDKKQGI